MDDGIRNIFLFSLLFGIAIGMIIMVGLYSFGQGLNEYDCRVMTHQLCTTMAIPVIKPTTGEK